MNNKRGLFQRVFYSERSSIRDKRVGDLACLCLVPYMVIEIINRSVILAISQCDLYVPPFSFGTELQVLYLINTAMTRNNNNT